MSEMVKINMADSLKKGQILINGTPIGTIQGVEFNIPTSEFESDTQRKMRALAALMHPHEDDIFKFAADGTLLPGEWYIAAGQHIPVSSLFADLADQNPPVVIDSLVGFDTESKCKNYSCR